jgi:hypothetical protein
LQAGLANTVTASQGLKKLSYDSVIILPAKLMKLKITVALDMNNIQGKNTQVYNTSAKKLFHG